MLLAKDLTDISIMYASMLILPNYKAQAATEAAIIKRNEPRYHNIAQKTGVPSHVIGLAHMLECGSSFAEHLHNGDPLTNRTVHVPKGRPLKGSPPFTFDESAIDALTMIGFTAVKDWSVPNTLLLLEKYNGLGYRGHGINSPYIWSGCQYYIKGKYGQDGKFDPNLISKQVGCALVLKALGL